MPTRGKKNKWKVPKRTEKAKLWKREKCTGQTEDTGTLAYWHLPYLYNLFLTADSGNLLVYSKGAVPVQLTIQVPRSATTRTVTIIA